MRYVSRLCTIPAVAVAVLVPAGLLAQGDAKPMGDAPPATAVKEAIGKGLEYLRRRQDEKGHWIFDREVREANSPESTPRMQEDPSFNLGLTALVALAMLENGVVPSDPAIQKAYAYVKEESLTNKRTYNLGLSILFLSRMGSRQDRPQIQRLARRLMLGQYDSGGWHYDCPLDVEAETNPRGLQGHVRKNGVGDNSNTQFAVLGLWAASRAGAAVDEPLELVAKRFRGSQAESGGWDYQSTGKADSNAMTCAGAYALTVAAASANRKAGSTSSNPQKPAQDRLGDDPVFQKALTRVEQFSNEIGPNASPYFLWSVERLAVTLNLPKIGSVDWYAKGAKALIESQKKDGSWEIAWKGSADTAFSLLFLRKAHLGRDISYALTGDASKPFVLIGKEKPQPFAKLVEAVAAAGDGDTIEIMGHGPFELAGVKFAEKSLTLRGGEGFEPVFVYKLEPLQDVDKDDLRFLFRVSGTRLNLEGIRLQMDPATKSKEGFTVIALDGGELRAMNCSLTQSSKTVVAGIELRGASKLALQNCMLLGCARAIDALPDADQEIKLENCLVHTPIAIHAKSPTPNDQATLSVQLARNTIHVAEVVNLGGLAGAAEFNTEANIFKTSAFSTALRSSAASPAARKWDGRRNVFDLTRWLSTAGQAVREVKDLDTWRKYWKTKEEGSFSKSIPFANARQLGPFRHNASPNDWRVTLERLSPDLPADVQLGCDVYLVGPGQPYFQFKESIAHDSWQKAIVRAEPKEEN